MQAQDERAWIDVNCSLGPGELARACGLSHVELGELMDYGVLAQAGGEDGETLFTADCVLPLREAARLRRVYDLDVFTLGLLFGYLQRLQSLESELRSVRARVAQAIDGAG